MRYFERLACAATLTTGLLTLSSLAMAGEVKSLGAIRPVIGKQIDVAKFSPLINPGRGVVRRERDHATVMPREGRPNSLVAGGINTLNRIAGTSNFPAVGATGFEPPDPDMAVGPNHIINVVNSDIAVFSKTGAKLMQQSFQNFFASVGIEAFDFDPKVVYDQTAKRWIVLQLGLNEAATGGTSSLLIGVSNNENAMGQWKLFKVDAKLVVSSTEFWLDYPGLGFNKDTVAISGNMFQMGGGGAVGTQILAFPKDTLYSGTATGTKFHLPSSFTVQMAKSTDTASPSVYGAETNNTSAVTLTAVTRSGSAFSVVQKDVTVPQWQFGPFGVTGVNGLTFNAVGNRTFSASQRLDRLVSSHMINSNGRASARWYDFKLNNWPASGQSPVLAQSGTIVPPAGSSYTFPSVSLDKLGSVALAFCRLAPNTTGETMVCARKKSDAVGTMSAPVPIAKGPGTSYSGFSNRWATTSTPNSTQATT